MKRTRPITTLLLLVVLAACGRNAAPPADQALELNLGYGARGVAVAPLAGDPGGGEAALTLVVSDGQALLAGYGCRTASADCSSDSDWLAAAWKLDAAGRPDANFASGGVFVSADPAGGNDLSVIFDAEAVAGGYRLAGVDMNAASDLDAVLWAVRPDGTLDPGYYGGNPAVVSDWAGAGYHDFVHALRSQPGFTWLAGGVDAGSDYDVAVWKVKDDGTPDSSFDGDGVWTYTTGTGDDWANDLALDGDGNLWLAGALVDVGNTFPVVWKLDPASGLVAEFGTGGWAKLPLLGGDDGFAVTLTFDGDRALVAGCVSGTFSSAGGAVPLGMALNGGSNRIAVWRLGPDGAPDPAFGGDGAVLLPETSSCGLYAKTLGLAVDGEGRYWIAGGVVSDRGDLDMAVWRLLPDGTLDPHFCGGGPCTFDNAAGGFGDDWGTSLALEGEDVFVAGWSWNGSRRVAVIWKLNLVESAP